jgi:hypothetical protein
MKPTSRQGDGALGPKEAYQDAHHDRRGVIG